MDISIVIPLYNEAESLPELFAWIERVMKEHNFSYEVIFINDGSTDNSWEVIEALKNKNPEVVHAVKFRRNYGKSPGLNCGFQRAKGNVVIKMVMTWCPVGRKSVTTRCRKPSRQSCSTLRHVNSPALRTCMTSTAG